MIKILLFILAAFFFIFILINFFKNKNSFYKNLFILFIIGLIIYFIYTGKVGFLISFLRSILPNLLKIIGI
ncbi:MAG: hypothetical protein CFH28_00924 [Alphaproteobacteria bacterium MarineAlpha6_Bin6]|nr:MAG: hypothetical protein CFH28_00924 [Alphaproteobacteria bacterium MarineAlpha6_Bin6]PPR33224.1 MAG: hypothetical protein CFH27_00642 [Alphaproteobacteria bacterium MarineAlpha6_Bin5]